MHGKSTFVDFENGRLVNSEGGKSLDSIPWNKHPTFDGVSLKHIVTGNDSNGVFSYHLVRIEPCKMIGEHTHDPQLETHEVIAGDGVCRNGEHHYNYTPGTIAILPAGIQHEVTAHESGLLLFAKFIPPLC